MGGRRTARLSDHEPLAENPVVFDWSWTLAAEPATLWPLVSDTNRMNLLANMAPVQFEETPNPEGGSDRVGRQKMLGLPVAWDEHPFEWAFPYGFSVLREFHYGILKAYRSSVAMQPDGPNTRLTHRVELVPRLGLMAPFVRREGVKLQKAWDHAYKAVDAHVKGEGPYPFENMAAPKQPGDPAALLAGADDPELARKIFDHVIREHAHELGHVRPFVLADRWRAGREDVLGAFLGVSRKQLLIPQWSLLCPHCRGAKGTAATLDGLADTVHCQACNIHFGKAADDVVELSFRPDPRYRQAQEASYCVGGPGATPHVFFQTKLVPGMTRDAGLSVPPGPYRLRGPRMKGHVDVFYHAGPLPAPPEGEEADPAPPLAVMLASDGPQVDGPLHLDGPKLRIRIANGTESVQDVVIEARSWRDDVVTLAWLKERPALLAAFEGAQAAGPA